MRKLISLLLVSAASLMMMFSCADAQLASQYTTFRSVKGDDHNAFAFNVNAESPAFIAKGFEVVAKFNLLADMFIAEESSPIDRSQYDAGIEVRRVFNIIIPTEIGYGLHHTSNGLGTAPSPTSVVADSSQSLNRHYGRLNVPYEVAGLKGTVGVVGWFTIDAGTSQSTAGLTDVIGWGDVGVIGSFTAEYTPEGDTKPTLLLGLSVQRNQFDAQLGVAVSSMISRLITVDGDSHWSRLYTLLGYQDGQYSRIGNWGEDVRALDIGLAYNLID